MYAFLVITGILINSCTDDANDEANIIFTCSSSTDPEVKTLKETFLICVKSIN